MTVDAKQEPRIVTIISAYNEEESIEKVIDDFKENATIDSDLLVLDNSSTDATLEIVRECGVDYLTHAVNSGGFTGAIKSAIAYAYEENYDIYCNLDGDFQHRAKDLEAIVEPIRNDEADIVFASRFIDRVGFQSSFMRRVGIHSFSWLIRWLTKYEITDITNGQRAYSRKAITVFAKHNKWQYEPTIEMVLLARMAGLRLVEVPAILRPRVAGESLIGFVESIKWPLYGLVAVFGMLLQKRAPEEGDG